MTDILLRELEVSNFRSIKGTIHAPLDAKVVLIHGENGAGKTSLLAAIELALTGRVMSLQRADPLYMSQLLHRPLVQGGPTQGIIDLHTEGLADGNRFQSIITAAGTQQQATLQGSTASYFSERCYLPQSLLGQLLQIYQDSDSSPDSPLSRFVTELLGLDRLDAIETGLGPVADIRNLRKTTDRYGQVEYEKTRLERTLAEHRRTREAANEALKSALAELNIARSTLGLTDPIDETRLDPVSEELLDSVEEGELSELHDRRRRLEAITREADRGADAGAQQDESALASAHREASEQLQSWQAQFDGPLNNLRQQIGLVLPDLASTQLDSGAYQQQALSLLRERGKQAAERSLRGSQDTKRQGEINNELDVARRNLQTIDEEIGRIAENSGNLGAILAELTSFVEDDVCPVCDRDFGEKGEGSLSDHLNHKVRRLTTSAERLLGLTRNRSTQQTLIDRLERELADIQSRILDQKAITDLDRTAAAMENLVRELERLAPAMDEGARRASAETASRRALSEHQSRNLARTAAMGALVEFAASMGQIAPNPIDTPQNVAVRLLTVIEDRTRALNLRMAARTRARDLLGQAKVELDRRKDADQRIVADGADYRRVEDALKRANTVRADAQTIKNQVEAVRSKIIGREFNDRLNRLWRDLFVRLAPNEPYVPAFKIPTESTQRLQPKLITTHRNGGAGGTPGAMLSAGNLNTAALTLFIALHLTVSAQLPWLILDDPVQSMDDIHITHFAALLRTLSKQHNRQVIIAVHDRQLFEYLRLELGPAFEGDSLRTLELSRGPTKDTLCLPDRRSFKKETALRFAA
ncbi:AAA family ATPase [Rhizobium lentis]|uniref:AAA family ATPase n=1 Tax=Rhizobium lentis TaxID=1138194 RepID=UPI001C82EBFA|nr:AAA family ATPase [Rhizobium lentis]MBX5086728.1 AAA family ATPase [Rhizobium lentis]MBX5099373.1 AAA family ATPase [Rhizobium lentis]MBX5124290.1 AAA family ATPase [Rhizobium lentis]